jgi:hypothetical protein
MTKRPQLLAALFVLLFTAILTKQASALYDPGVGRFCSRDPIGYEDGKNLFSNYFQTWGLDPNGTSCSPADCIDRCRSLPESGSIFTGSDVIFTNPRQNCIDDCKRAAKLFLEWYDEQVRLGRPNYGALATCPCNIGCDRLVCIPLGIGLPPIINRIRDFCAPEGWYFPPAQWTYLPRYHPGAVKDMRSNAGPPYVQCTYDANGDLITTGPGIGTIDEGSIPFEGHIGLDVWPVDWVITLEGGVLQGGCWFNMYKRMRPPRTGKCKRNP